MTEANPLEPIIEELNEMLKLIEKDLQRPQTGKEVSPELIQKLRGLEKKMGLFQLQLVSLLKEAQINPKDLAAYVANVKDNKLMDRLHAVKSEVTKMQAMFFPYVRKAQAQQATVKKKAVKRKKKFRGLGRGDLWKKM